MMVCDFVNEPGTELHIGESMGTATARSLDSKLRKSFRSARDAAVDLFERTGRPLPVILGLFFQKFAIIAEVSILANSDLAVARFVAQISNPLMAATESALLSQLLDAASAMFHIGDQVEDVRSILDVSTHLQRLYLQRTICPTTPSSKRKIMHQANKSPLIKLPSRNRFQKEASRNDVNLPKPKGGLISNIAKLWRNWTHR
ncbi:hypothetical protein DFS34DRAFT_245253 [Phlyctochytrium arcticum]|nr:hypothetical protein DFS34DRAFT_245253 [Phlyctochytrium arcticum]